MSVMDVTETSELAAASARAAAEAAAMLAAADPAAVGRPLPVVEVTVGKKTNEVSAPLRRGGPLRVKLTPKVLRATPEQRRFTLAHELSHFCRGDVVDLIDVPWPTVITAGVTAAVELGLIPVVRRVHVDGWVGGVVLAAAVAVVGAVLAGVFEARRAARTRVGEAVTDRFAAEVFGAAVTDFDMTRWAGTKQETGRWLRTHPYPAERYAATNAALRAVTEQRRGPVDDGQS